MNQIYVQTDGVRSFAQIHDQVASALSQVIGGGAAEATGVTTSHGTIASAVSSALSSVLGARHGTMQTTATSSTTIAELLQKAARMYEGGDQEGADKLRRAAEALQEAQAGGGAPGGGAPAGGVPAGGAPAGGVPAGGGTEIAGQIAGQVGQVVGGLTGSIGGLVGGLAQIPQQVMQGVQGATSGVSGGLGGEHPMRDEFASPRDPYTEDRTPQEESDTTPTDVQDRQFTEGAAGGTDTGERAPAAPAESQPAQTRPQSL
ncbi:type VII secretion target [Mycolicibacterium phlei]